MADLLVSVSGPLASLHVELQIDGETLFSLDTDPLFSLLGDVLDSVTGGGLGDVPGLGGLLTSLLGSPESGPTFGNDQPAVPGVLYLDDLTTITLPGLPT